MKVLVIEDDALIAEVLKTLFSSRHFAVDITATGEVGLEMAEAFDYDLVLLDIRLPGIDGISVCRQFRDRGFRIPILLLTALDDPQQKASALNAGADDYVVKPFDVDELMARAQALLRRGETQTQPILTWGSLSVDPRSFTVTYGSQPLSLTPKEYGILVLFLRNCEQVFSAQTILDRVWSSAESPGEEAVRVHIKDLRKKLTAVGAPKNLIKTVHRIGYRLNPAYAAVPTSRSDEPPPTLSSAPAALSQQGQGLTGAQPLTAPGRPPLQVRNEELERQVADLTAALAEANHRLQPADEAPQRAELSQQAHQIAHDLNNVFTPMMATVQMLRQTQAGQDKATQERLQRLENVAKRGADLVGQLLALIREMTKE